MATLLRNYRDHWRLASKPARRYLTVAVLMGFAQAVTWSMLARYLDATGYAIMGAGLTSILAAFIYRTISDGRELTMNMPVAATAFLLRGALMNSTHPIHNNLMISVTAPEVREAQTGINATLWGLGWVIGPWLGGKVLENSGTDYSLLMYTTMGCYVVAAVLTYVMIMLLERGIAKEPA
ncbi:MAG: hypothetical protein GY930_05890 [bacterium]|nr:hypothetical protein [bacterium]